MRTIVGEGSDMSATNEITVRLHYRRADGTIEDAQQDYGLADFAGVLPSIGDQILDPGVVSGRKRDELGNRRLWTVVGRVFNPRDNRDYVALIVDERIPSEAERAFVT
jgi:hypothetical protein